MIPGIRPNATHLAVACPHCHAAVGEQCRAVGSLFRPRRRPAGGTHPSRLDAVRTATDNPSTGATAPVPVDAIPGETP